MLKAQNGKRENKDYGLWGKINPLEAEGYGAGAPGCCEVGKVASAFLTWRTEANAGVTTPARCGV
jgi:hypothetical protein